MFGLKEIEGKDGREIGDYISFIWKPIREGMKWREGNWKEELLHILTIINPFNIGKI